MPFDFERYANDDCYYEGATGVCDELFRRMPESWKLLDMIDPELVIQYIQTIENRLIARGGSLERGPDDLRPGVPGTTGNVVW